MAGSTLAGGQGQGSRGECALSFSPGAGSLVLTPLVVKRRLTSALHLDASLPSPSVGGCWAGDVAGPGAGGGGHAVVVSTALKAPPSP